MLTINDVLFFDVETTGLPEKGQKYETDYMKFPKIVSIAWSYQGKESEYIIFPETWEIPDDAAKIHGITTEIAISNGNLLEDVLREFFNIAFEAKLICAHNIYFDTSTLKAASLCNFDTDYHQEIVEEALDKSKRIDTMMKTIKFVGAKKENGGGKTPTLTELFTKLFPGETFDAHDALEDVLALKKCLPELVKLGIIELKPKEYPTEQTKMDLKPTKTKLKEFTDLGKSAGMSTNDFAVEISKIQDLSPLEKAENFENSVDEGQQKWSFTPNPNALLDEDNF